VRLQTAPTIAPYKERYGTLLQNARAEVWKFDGQANSVKGSAPRSGDVLEFLKGAWPKKLKELGTWTQHAGETGLKLMVTRALGLAVGFSPFLPIAKQCYDQRKRACVCVAEKALGGYGL
jgi:hypothetical protein